MEIYTEKKLDIQEMILLVCPKKGRICHVFPDNIVAIRPILNSVEMKDYTIEDKIIKKDLRIRIEFTANCLFIENLLTSNINNPNKRILGLYVIYQSGVQSFSIEDLSDSSIEEPKIIEFKLK